MPYNPGSAYPRKTTYVPPTYGDTSFKPAVNAPDFAPKSGYGGTAAAGRGRSMFAGAAADARAAAVAPDAATGLLSMQNQGMAAQLQNRYMEHRGLKKGAGNTEVSPDAKDKNLAGLVPGAGTVAPQPPTGPGTPSHGNPAAQATRAAETEIADTLVNQELTGQLPGPTGAANLPKSKTNPN